MLEGVVEQDYGLPGLIVHALQTGQQKRFLRLRGFNLQTLLQRVHSHLLEVVAQQKTGVVVLNLVCVPRSRSRGGCFPAASRKSVWPSESC